MTVASRLDRLELSRFHYRLLILSGLGWLFDAMDTGLLSFVLARLKVEWHLTPGQVGWTGSASMLGMLIGGALSGSLADRYGRKAVFQTTLVLFSVATGLCALAWNLPSLLALRLLVGIGLGGELPVAASLVSEFAPARYRGRLVVLLESFWAFGWAAAAIIADQMSRWAERRGVPFPWRWAFLIGALPALYVLVLRRSLPESPRFLLAHGRRAEAAAIVASIEPVGGAPGDGASTEAAFPEGAVSPTLAVDPFETQARPARPAELFAVGIRRRTVMLWSLWFAMAYSYYGNFIWLPTLFGNRGLTMARSFSFTLYITLAQIPGYFAAAWLVERIGRKKTLVPFMLLCAVSSYFFGNAATNAELILWGALVSFFNLGAWGVTYGYTPELYPTRLRGTGAGWAAAFGRSGAILAPFMVGQITGAWGHDGFGAVFLMFAAVLAAGAVVVAALGEETHGRTLEEISDRIGG